MWGRPVRQATAHAAPVHDAAVGAELDVLVHRNELNEQQRPGQLVLVPLQRDGGSKRWSAKLLRNMSCAEDGATITNCVGLLVYTGADIDRGNLDPNGVIPSALKKAYVSFLTNHVHSADSGRGMVSGMRGTPIELGPNGGLVDVRTRDQLRADEAPDRRTAQSHDVGDLVEARDSCGQWYEARVMRVRGEDAKREWKVHFKGWNARYDEWVAAERLREVGSAGAEDEDEGEETAEEHHEHFLFGGFIAFDVKAGKDGKDVPDKVSETSTLIGTFTLTVICTLTLTLTCTLTSQVTDWTACKNDMGLILSVDMGLACLLIQWFCHLYLN